MQSPIIDDSVVANMAIVSARNVSHFVGRTYNCNLSLFDYQATIMYHLYE